MDAMAKMQGDIRRIQQVIAKAYDVQEEVDADEEDIKPLIEKKQGILEEMIAVRQKSNELNKAMTDVNAEIRNKLMPRLPKKIQDMINAPTD